MVDVHWFDTVSKQLVQESSRRRVARSLAVLLPGLTLAGLAGTADARNRGKKNGGKQHRGGNKNHKRKSGRRGGRGGSPTDPGPGGSGGGPSDPGPVGPPDVCDTTFADAHDQEYCKFIRGECSGFHAGEFCIATNFSGKEGQNVAVCCDADQCCGSECCSLYVGHQCCEGTCRHVDQDDNNCGVCGKQCPIGQHCYAGRCENRACTGGLDCPPGMPCVNGECTCGAYNYCFHPDLGHGVCSSGDCGLLN